MIRAQLARQIAVYLITGGYVSADVSRGLRNRTGWWKVQACVQPRQCTNDGRYPGAPRRASLLDIIRQQQDYRRGYADAQAERRPG
jgi:hypothetical protein